MRARVKGLTKQQDKARVAKPNFYPTFKFINLSRRVDNIGKGIIAASVFGYTILHIPPVNEVGEFGS